jgi:hypothetical protein
MMLRRLCCESFDEAASVLRYRRILMKLQYKMSITRSSSKLNNLSQVWWRITEESACSIAANLQQIRLHDIGFETLVID